MTYAAAEDMQARFNHQDLVLLTEREHSTPGEVDMAVLTQALEDATAEINAYLSGRYTLPLSTVPTALVRVCCDVARYFLSGDNAPEHIQTRYTDALKFLQAVNQGKVALGIDSQGDKATTNDTAVMESAGSVFARNKAKGFI
ncbi:phage protein Gp36 family protein [Pseudoalteromonas piscicida]|uniref:gp436 family protein n=1 Tax=Pseudoalteromonas piscicida TaxID=43662 RepID=UPI0030CA0ED8